MPRGSWRWVVAVGVTCVAAGGASAQPVLFPAGAPPAQLPPGSAALTGTPPGQLPPGSAAVTTAPPAQLPPGSAHVNEPPVKDLTPPGFADDHDNDHTPSGEFHPAYHDTPGHLRPAAPEEGGPFAAAELLVMRPRRGAFDFVIPGDTTGLVPNGPARSLNYDIQGGLRAELGYRFGHSGWDASFAYTYFHSSARGTLQAAPGTVLFPTLTRPGLTDTVLAADATGDLNYNLYDLLVGRRFAVDEHLALRAFGGVRFANIRQGIQANYDGLDARRAAVLNRSDFDGFGPIIGGEAVLSGWKGFHLYARASGGLITGQSDNPLLDTNNAGNTVYANTGYDVRKVVPVATVGVGGGWQYRTFSVRAGYEVTNWFGLIDQPRLVDDLGPGKFVSRPANLSLEGLFVRMGLAF